MKLLALTAFATLVFCAAAPAAEIDGAWTFIFLTEAGERNAHVQLRASGNDVSGAMGEAPVKGTYANQELTLEFPFYSPDADLTANLRIQGKYEAGKITGEWRFAEYTGRFRATKQ